MFEVLFGKKSYADGVEQEVDWLAGYREGPWEELLTVKGPESMHVVEFVGRSVFNARLDVYAVTRTVDALSNSIGYSVIVVPKTARNYFRILVDRVEDLEGKVTTPDDWTQGRTINEAQVEGVAYAVDSLKSFALFNQLSIPPPYVMVVLEKLGLVRRLE